MAGRERHGPGWRVAQPTQCVAIRLRGDPPAESPASGMAYADVARHQRLAKPHLPDLLPPVRPHGPDRGHPPRHRERHGRGLRRGKLWRWAVDPARALHGTRLELAGCIAEPNREHHGPDNAAALRIALTAAANATVGATYSAVISASAIADPGAKASMTIQVKVSSGFPWGLVVAVGSFAAAIAVLAVVVLRRRRRPRT